LDKNCLFEYLDKLNLGYTTSPLDFVTQTRGYEIFLVRNTFGKKADDRTTLTVTPLSFFRRYHPFATITYNDKDYIVLPKLKPSFAHKARSFVFLQAASVDGDEVWELSDAFTIEVELESSAALQNIKKDLEKFLEERANLNSAFAHKLAELSVTTLLYKAAAHGSYHHKQGKLTSVELYHMNPEMLKNINFILGFATVVKDINESERLESLYAVRFGATSRPTLFVVDPPSLRFGETYVPISGGVTRLIMIGLPQSSYRDWIRKMFGLSPSSSYINLGKLRLELYKRNFVETLEYPIRDLYEMIDTQTFTVSACSESNLLRIPLYEGAGRHLKVWTKPQRKITEKDEPEVLGNLKTEDGKVFAKVSAVTIDVTVETHYFLISAGNHEHMPLPHATIRIPITEARALKFDVKLEQEDLFGSLSEVINNDEGVFPKILFRYYLVNMAKVYGTGKRNLSVPFPVSTTFSLECPEKNSKCEQLSRVLRRPYLFPFLNIAEMRKTLLHSNYFYGWLSSVMCSEKANDVFLLLSDEYGRIYAASLLVFSVLNPFLKALGTILGDDFLENVLVANKITLEDEMIDFEVYVAEMAPLGLGYVDYLLVEKEAIEEALRYAVEISSVDHEEMAKEISSKIQILEKIAKEDKELEKAIKHIDDFILSLRKELLDKSCGEFDVSGIPPEIFHVLVDAHLLELRKEKANSVTAALAGQYVPLMVEKYVGLCWDGCLYCTRLSWWDAPGSLTEDEQMLFTSKAVAREILRRLRFEGS